MNYSSNCATSKSWVKGDFVIMTMFRSSEKFIDRQIFIPVISIAEPSIDHPLNKNSEAYQTMLASEDILRKEWDTPEEDKAWENL